MPLVVSGRIPPLSEMFVPRHETGLSSAGSLPLGATVVLAPAESPIGAIGGTGKTQMAAAVTQELGRDDAVELVVWVAATSLDSVVCGYAQALRDVGAPAAPQSAEQAAGQFAAWLAATDRSWVVVLDDLREGAVPERLWPRGPAGRVLVTSSDPDAGARYDSAMRRVVPVGPFSAREAMSYLSGHLHTDTSLRTGALELARDLGFWPLALGQAAAVMTANGIGCREYHARLTEYQAALAAGQGGAGDLRDLAPAWWLAVRTADTAAPAGLASRALSLISLLAPHGIPGVVLTSPAACEYLTGRPGGPAERAQATQAVHNLARLGLVAVDGQSPASTVLVHPAVQSLARQYLPATERRGLVLAAADALLQAWSLPDVPEAVSQRLRDSTTGLHRLAGRLLWEGGCHPVLIQAGRSLRNADGRSVDYWGSLLAASERELGPAHPHTGLIREELGTACEASGRPQDAIALYERILSEQEQAAADDQDQTGVARVALARVYHAVGRDGDAIRLAQGALADVEDTPGSQLDQLIAQEALARAYLAAGQVGEAVAGFRQVLAGRERAQGPDHPMTSTARGELAAACQAAGRHKEALALCQRVLADCERLHGPGHLNTLAARAGLASAYQTAAKPRKAIPLYQRTLADRERLQGRVHADTIAARGDLAAAYLSAGQLALAVSQYETALAACQRALGPGHELTRATNNGLNTAVARGVAVRGIDLRSRVP